MLDIIYKIQKVHQTPIQYSTVPLQAWFQTLTILEFLIFKNIWKHSRFLKSETWVRSQKRVPGHFIFSAGSALDCLMYAASAEPLLMQMHMMVRMQL